MKVKIRINVIFLLCLLANCELAKNQKANMGFLSFLLRLSANRTNGNSNITNPTIQFSVIASTTATLTTSEAGATSTFTLKLSGEPTANVTINLSSSNPLEGVVSPNSVTFTTTDWNNPKTFTVTGIDDLIADGNINYQIITSNTISSDTNFNGLTVPDFNVTNLDVGEKITFVTSILFTGSLGGIAGADAKCNVSVNKPSILPNMYKAFLVDGVTRTAASNATSNGSMPGTQTDWVMKPNTAYFRTDGVKIINSNINGLYDLTVNSPSSFGGTVGISYWTGISNPNRWATGNHCMNWTTDLNGNSGDYGDGNSNLNIAVGAGFVGCEAGFEKRLLCIQQ
jgi:hypothetical protein